MIRVFVYHPIIQIDKKMENTSEKQSKPQELKMHFQYTIPLLVQLEVLRAEGGGCYPGSGDGSGCTEGSIASGGCTTGNGVL